METAAWFLAWTMVAPSLAAGGAAAGSISSSNGPKNDDATGGIPASSTTKKKYKHHVFGVERDIDIPEEHFPSEEELKQLEDLLPGCEHGWYDSCYGENIKLHYRKFLPPKSSESTKPKAVVIYHHGISTHGGKAYISKKDGRKLNGSLMNEMFVQKNHMALYMPDMYGHGYSEGVRFWIPDTWENNLRDIMNFITFVAQQHPNTPIFLFGESYGGCLTMHAARRYQDDPKLLPSPNSLYGILLTGPAIDADLPPAPVTYLLKNVLAPRYPQWRPFFMPNPISPDRIWRDPEVLKARTDPRYMGMSLDGSGIPFRLGTAANMIDAITLVREKIIPGFTVPFCLVHGVEDAGVPINGSDYFYQTAATPPDDKEYYRMEGVYHDVLSDSVAEETMEYYIRFIHKQIEKK